MAQLEGYYFSAALSCTFLVSCLLFSAFSRALREPYMDEIFHLPQAQRYCEGHFSLSQWDPMITTLPGLYLVSVGVVKPAIWIFGWSEHVVCSIGVLRFVNLLFSVGNFYLLYLLFRKVQPRNKIKCSIQFKNIRTHSNSETARQKGRKKICNFRLAHFSEKYLLFHHENFILKKLPQVSRESCQH
ncbi:dol-P-Glc:Glc(2)Man(9)GlcNAc(2)-PP-Dol alpha-1,2-glucosyltransferase isoform X2 [Symphalangus syndactylus]|uniref:dol-P-Glc:Glc(2)Man(9)GlcNAc(2)-PP-Dol alpha-1,2-glucosyltransferase isoform X2 n=1 Tax=Symphalangus syndactylus TaxID=9590 RepID=UPI0030060938